tara:strand:- start:1011 stop:1889 length:879 start_codon:yes stop_codon:yes gene_type:complete
MNQLKILISFALIIHIQVFSQQKKSICQTADDPSRIVSIGSSITEIIYFLNSQDQIIAIDITSNFPEDAKKFPSVGYIRNLSAEGLLSTNPSIIISEDDIGPKNIIKQIQDTKTELRIIPEEQTLNGIIQKIQCVGNIIGQQKEAEEKISSEINPVINKIKEIKKEKDLSNIKIMMILSTEGNSTVVAGANTSGDSFIKMLGATNIFESINGWKAVTAETILLKNPDYIIIPEKDLHKQSNVNTISENMILKETNAGKNNGYIIKDGMAILGYGPRTIFTLMDVLNTITDSN